MDARVSGFLRVRVGNSPVRVEQRGNPNVVAMLRPGVTYPASAQAFPSGNTEIVWITLPTMNDFGLPLLRWKALWDKAAVEIESRRDGAWHDFFT